MFTKQNASKTIILVITYQQMGAALQKGAA